MQSKLKILLFSLFGLVLLVQFTNCSGIEPGGDAQLSSTQCVGSLCVGPQPELLSLRITENPTISTIEGSDQLLISGKCSTGNFESHYIEIQHMRASTGFFETHLPFRDICKTGNFYVSIGLPGLGPGERVQMKAPIFGGDGQQEVESLRSPYNYFYQNIK